MKKLSVFLVVILSCVYYAKSVAQTPLNVYEGKNVSGTPHVFSSSATVFSAFAPGTDMSELWLKPGKHDTLCVMPDNLLSSTPVGRTGNYTLPAAYTFGQKNVRYFGLSGAGMVYFGETDTLYPAVNAYDAMGSFYIDKVQDYIMSVFYSYKVEYWGSFSQRTEQVVRAHAGENTSVKFEFSPDNDTLFIAYDNLRIEDVFGQQTAYNFSFQYAVLRQGGMFLIPVSMQNAAAPDITTGANSFCFSMGMVARTQYNSIFLANYNGNVNSGNYSKISITDVSYPVAGTFYGIVPPPDCEPVAEPSVLRWTAEPSSDYIELSQYSVRWTLGDKLLLVLSTHDTLKGTDLPVDNHVYDEKSVIGTSAGVLVGSKNEVSDYYTSNFPVNVFRNLQPNTQYYIHAFPYYTTCSGGPAYNTEKVPVLPVKTYPAPPQVFRLRETTLTVDGFTLDITSENPYLIGACSHQLPSDARWKLSGTYAKGDKLIYKHVVWKGSDERDTVIYEVEVLEGETTAPTFAVSGTKEGTDYYYYAWTNLNHGEKYSDHAAVCGVSTPHTVPATVTFASAMIGETSSPAGWEYESENGYRFTVENTSRAGTFIYVPMMPRSNAVSESRAVSPVIDALEYGELLAQVDFYFWKVSDVMEVEGTKLRSNDKVTVEYKGVNENTWTVLGTVTSSQSTSNGKYTLKIPVFKPSEREIRFRITMRCEAVEEALEEVNASVCGFTVEPGLPCEPVQDIKVVDSLTSAHSAVLVWEDGNTAQAKGFKVAWRETGTASWQFRTVSALEATLDGLKPYTAYEAEISAVCGINDTALARRVSFTTIRTLPYRPVLENCRVPEDIELMTGTLPASGAAVEFLPHDHPCWDVVQADEESSDSCVLGLENMSQENTDNDLWLMFPALDMEGKRGKLALDFTLEAWSINAEGGSHRDEPVFGETDKFYVLVSSDGRFSRRNIVDSVDLSLLNREPVSYTFLADVQSPLLYVAVFTRFDLPQFEDDDNDSVLVNSLIIRSLYLNWGRTVCEPVYDVQQSALTKTGIDIAWAGESLEYAVCYKNRRADEYDTLFTSLSFCRLENLTPSTAYQYFIFGYCEENRQNPSQPSDMGYFTTVAECPVPEFEISTVTDSSVTLHITEEGLGCEIEVYPRDPTNALDTVYREISISNYITLKGLDACGEKVDFYARARRFCAWQDTSRWSEEKPFTTLEKPQPLGPEGRTWGLGLRVKAGKDWINIENTDNLYIAGVEVYTATGVLYRNYPVNRCGDVSLWHNLRSGMVLITVLGKDGRKAVYKAVIL